MIERLASAPARVSGRARQSAIGGPASVAVGNDGNMQGLPPAIGGGRTENVLQNYLLRGHGNVSFSAAESLRK